MLKKRALFTVPISIILIAVMVTSFFLLSIKPDTSHIKKSQKLSEYAKPAVVRVVSEVSVEWQFREFYSDLDALMKEYDYKTGYRASGSGAIISSDGYVVTNAHVVAFDDWSEDDIITEAFYQLVDIVSSEFQLDYDLTTVFLLSIVDVKDVNRKTTVVLPGGDKLKAEIKQKGTSILEEDGKDVAVLKVEGKNLPTLKLGNSDSIEDQDNIWVIGYPGAADAVGLFSPDSLLESSMNGGQISATSKKLDSGASVIQINAAISGGNSGGPVINEKGEIIGLATASATDGYQQIQGFNFAVPVNIVKEFVNQSGAKNTSSNTDKLYREGLELYWGGYYKDALEKFESVQRIFPDHSEIKDYITNSEKKIDESKILWSNYATIFYVVDGVLGLLIIFLMLFTFVFKPKVPQVIAFTATAGGAGVATAASTPTSTAATATSVPSTAEPAASTTVTPVAPASPATATTQPDQSTSPPPANQINNNSPSDPPEPNQNNDNSGSD